MKKAAVLGFPVEHSLSPKLHMRWLKECGIPGSYEAIAVAPDALEEKFKQLVNEGYAGWNVTVPHKEAALKLMDELDETATKISAVNTVVVRGGKLHGSNTDAYGFAANLQEKLGRVPTGKTVVLGAGGAARAILYALAKAGVSGVALVNRSREKADALAANYAGMSLHGWENIESAMQDADMMVNTTSLGLTEPMPSLPWHVMQKDAVVADIVYKPLMTPFLQEAQSAGKTTVTGIGMLIHQAVPGFQAWFGATPTLSKELETWLSQ